ncbi:glycosyl hydrolase family 65 protein [Lacticaseibacillus jixianensis]|uniref:Glycosyl hydrolase family 65 protein n=1 Tax=Lacticaseibacillus jixianensis TaxID=2486012 RepID=A0ABW4BB96_9LACO|nr:glycosyl hydrolase family 65 protein [Lacticaseibacillus jixianensis]
MNDAAWQLTATGYEADQITDFGNRFLLANGYMGYRGTLAEYTKAQQVALNLAGVYDRRGDQWRETVNAPNPLFTRLMFAGQPLSVLTQQPLTHSVTLDFKAATFSRRSVFQAGGARVTVSTLRFLSGADHTLGGMRYTVVADAPVAITLTCGIDQQVWDINGPHLTAAAASHFPGGLAVVATTGELHRQVGVWQKQFLPEAAGALIQSEHGQAYAYALQLTPQQPVTLTVLFGVGVDDNCEAVAAKVRAADQTSFDGWLAAHRAAWQGYWQRSDVRIEGNDADQKHLRYSIYQLLAIAPHHARAQSIPARGLSGQTYKGAIFWDTEMFMLPFFLATDAETAHSLIGYRLKGLKGAKAKAQSYGFEGAFYAWESQEDGFDACSDYNVTDVFTKRPMRTYFRDKQVHISGAIALAIWQSYQWLDDLSLLTGGGAEVILECARFYLSYAKAGLLDQVVSIDDVIGPDEYHERVNNNAYTNKLVQTTWQIALQTLQTLEAQAPAEAAKLVARLDFHPLISKLQMALARLKQPTVDDQGVIEQFDGYFKLEDASVATVRARLLDPHEYWGGAYGVASQTQVLKQADVVMMLALFPDDYSAQTHAANYAYYEPRTEHGSSLSWSMYAIEAARMGKTEAAHHFFEQTATVDLTGQSKQWAGDIYIGGTHPAGNAGAWLVALRGFAGMHVAAGRLQFTPHLPQSWHKMAFQVNYQGHAYEVTIANDHATVNEMRKK